jgi:transcription elongation factor GreA
MLNKPVYVTQQGLADLEKELEELQTEKRPRLIDRLHEVKSGGDWMENTEQMMFEDELAFVDRRIQELEGMIADAEIIEQDLDNSVVHIGDTVVVQEENEEPETYTIVGAAEANPSEGMISNESPMGRALLNKKVGAKVTVKAPAGELVFRLISLK